MVKKLTSIEEIKTNRDSSIFSPNIAVLGVGGAGNNAVSNLLNKDIKGVKFIIANTDVKALESSNCSNKIRLGWESNKGLGAGANPDLGFSAAEESIEEIKEQLEDIDLLFITAGMGGGTGTGASQVISKIAREMGILTIAVVTTPFEFEGVQRLDIAKNGLDELKKLANSIIVISNQNIFKIIEQNTSLKDAYRITDEVLYSSVKAISDVIMANGMINLDFNDVKNVVENGGVSMVSLAEASGSDRVSKITSKIIYNPLIEGNFDISKATNILINITGSSDLTLFEVDKIVTSLRKETGNTASVNFGAIIDEDVTDTIKVVVIATGIDDFNFPIKKLYSRNIKEVSNDSLAENNHNNGEDNILKVEAKDDMPVSINIKRSTRTSQVVKEEANLEMENDKFSRREEEKEDYLANVEKVNKTIIKKREMEQEEATSLFSLIEQNIDNDKESEEEVMEMFSIPSQKKKDDDSKTARKPKAASKNIFDIPSFLKGKKD